MRFNLDLRFRVALAFAAFGALLSLVFSGWLYFATHALGVNLMDDTLEAELEDYRARRHRNPDSLPPATVTVLGYVRPAPPAVPPIPGVLDGARPGLHTIRIAGVPYRLLVQDADGVRYYMLYNETHQAARETRFLWVLGAGVAMMALLASAGGLWLAGRVIAPVADLAGRVRELDPEADHPPMAKDFPHDELGALASAFDRYLSRLRAFIERERAFTADVSHELRTPLSIIQGAAEIQAEDESLSPRQRNRALRLQRAAREMAEITTALLALARERKLRASGNCQVAEVVRDAVEKHRHLLEGKSTEVALEVAGDPRLAADRALLFIVVGNIVRNAFQHTDRGTVRIAVDHHRLRVADTGRGIPEEHIEQVFQHLFRGEGSRGEGIGLALTKRICDRYGWDIGIESCAGCGAVVELRFDSDADLPAAGP